MTIQELERQLLTLDRNERIRIIQVMARKVRLGWTYSYYNQLRSG